VADARGRKLGNEDPDTLDPVLLERIAQAVQQRDAATYGELANILATLDQRRGAEAPQNVRALLLWLLLDPDDERALGLIDRERQRARGYSYVERMLQLIELERLNRSPQATAAERGAARERVRTFADAFRAEQVPESIWLERLDTALQYFFAWQFCPRILGC
jgi:hypothetical protein